MPAPWVIKLSRSHRRRLGIYGGAEAANWWDGLSDVWAAYQPKGAASLAASYTDLSGGGHNATVGVAPTWDVTNGWKFNGTNQYLKTAFLPNQDATQTMIVQFSNATIGGTHAVCGCQSAGDTRFYLYHDLASKVFYGAGGSGGYAPNLASGNLCISGYQGYRNGSPNGSPIAVAYSGAPTETVAIGCSQRAGPSFVHFLQGYIQALALCSSTNTAEQIATAASAMAAL